MERLSIAIKPSNFAQERSVQNRQAFAGQDKMRRSIDKYLFVIYFFKLWKTKVEYCNYMKEVLIRLIYDLGKFQNQKKQGKAAYRCANFRLDNLSLIAKKCIMDKFRC